MSKPRKIISKISDKLTKVDESFTINMYDNGFMVEVRGRDAADEWVTTKILVADIEQLVALVREAADMDRND